MELGATAELLPYLRGGSRNREGCRGRRAGFSKETERYRQMHGRMGGFVSYPFSRARRLELSGGVRHITSAHLLRTRVFSSTSRKLLRDVDSREVRRGRCHARRAQRSADIRFGRVGAGKPCVGNAVAPGVQSECGRLSFASVLVDYRRYLMPVRPFTLATRFRNEQTTNATNHMRLEPHFVGYRSLVRGYDFSSLIGGCTSTLPDECDFVDRLTGSVFPCCKHRASVPAPGCPVVYPYDGPNSARGCSVRRPRSRDRRGFCSLAPARVDSYAALGASIRIAPFGFVVELGAVEDLRPSFAPLGFSARLSPRFLGNFWTFPQRARLPKHGLHLLGVSSHVLKGGIKCDSKM